MLLIIIYREYNIIIHIFDIKVNNIIIILLILVFESVLISNMSDIVQINIHTKVNKILT